MLALPLAGCVEIKSATAVQQQTIGQMRITTTLCPTSSAPSSTCPNSNTNSSDDAGGNDAQFMIGYRVPLLAGVPDTVTATRGSSTITLTRSFSYEDQLTNGAGAPGTKWIGYISPVVPQAQHMADTTFTVVANFGLPRPAGGAPAPGTFAWRVVAGARRTGAEVGAEPGRSVSCGPVLTNPNGNSGVGETTCVDSPLDANDNYAEFTTAPVFGSDSTSVKDAGVLDGGSVSVAAGSVVSVPFTIREVNLSSAQVFDLSAGTSAPGVTVSPSQSVFPGHAGASVSTDVPVSVTVPANTPPGTYNLTLTAQLQGTSQVRTGTRQLVITAPAGGGTAPPDPSGTGKPPEEDRIPPDGTYSLTRGQKLGKALKSGVAFKARCSEACNAIITLKRGKKVLATGEGGRTSAGSFSLKAKFTRAAKKKYRRSRSLRLAVQLVVDDNGGLTDTTTGTITLKR